MNIFSLYIRSFFIALLFILNGYAASAQTVSINPGAKALCTDSTVTISFTVSGTFNPGNIFTVELSDETGSFAPPVDIAADTTTTSGSVKWVIPSSLTLGTNYRIRIRASSPLYTSATDSVSIWMAASFPHAKSNSPVCYGDSIKITSSSDPLADVFWSGPAGFSSLVANPVILNADTINKGHYRVYASWYGCKSYPDSVLVNVLKVVPSVSINTGLTDTICNGTTVNFVATPSSGGTSPSYTWQKNGVMISSGSGYYSTSSLSNNDTIKVIMVSNAQCANPALVTNKTLMIVKPLPARSIASSNSPVCSTDAIALRASPSSSGATFHWTGPVGYTSALQNPTIASADSFKAGMYIVYAELNGCVSATDTDTVVVLPSVLPAVSLSYSPSDTICAGQTLNFTASPVNGGTAPSYKWYRNGVLVTGVTGNTYAADTLSNGDGIVCVLASSLTCPRPVTVSYSTTITVKPLPQIIGILANGPLCSSDTLKLSATSSLSGSDYSWTGPSGFSSPLQYPVIAPIDSSRSGTYTARASLNGCISAPATVDVSVANVVHPTANITVYPGTVVFANGEVTFTATATQTGSLPVYQWKKNGFDIAGANGTTYTTSNFRDNDSFTVALISSLPCAFPAKAISNSITMHVTEPIKLVNNITLFPNPTKGSFIIKGVDTTGTKVEVSIFSVVGKLVYSKTTAIVNGTFYQEVDLGGVADGMYMIHVKTDAEEKITRITIHH